MSKSVHQPQYSLSRSGFTLLEVLIAVVISATLFVLVSSILVSLFRSDTKSKHSQSLEQTKNDIKSELTNNVRWAGNVSHEESRLNLDGDIYELIDGRFVKNQTPLSHKDIEVSNFRVIKHTPVIDANVTNQGFGLTGIYYNEENFTGNFIEQIDSQINFDWGGGSVDEKIDPNTFSVKWSGQLESADVGDYSFKLESNDGARLWIDDVLVVDGWAGGIKTGSMRLDSKKRYNTLVEYRENLGDANIKLSWAPPGGSFEVVPSTQLYPNTLSTSLEIVMDLVHKKDSTLKNTLRTILTPRPGTIIGGILDTVPTPTDFPLPLYTPSNPPTQCIPGIDEISGWSECNGWNPRMPGFNRNYNKYACREKALQRARSFYDDGLPDPPSGSRDSTQGGSDLAWFNWGQKAPKGRHFLGPGTSCGIGPSHCEGKSCEGGEPGR